MTESEWTRKLCAEMIECGAFVRAIVGSRMQPRGLPDRYVIWCYRAYWLEFKSANGILTLNQRLTLRQINLHGQFAVVVRMPNRIEGYNGDILCTFDGTGAGLLRCLERLITV